MGFRYRETPRPPRAEESELILNRDSDHGVAVKGVYSLASSPAISRSPMASTPALTG